MSEGSRKRQRRPEDILEGDLLQQSTKRARNKEESAARQNGQHEEMNERAHPRSRHDRHRDRSSSRDRHGETRDRRMSRKNGHRDGLARDRHHENNVGDERSQRPRDSPRGVHTHNPSEASPSRRKMSVSDRSSNPLNSVRLGSQKQDPKGPTLPVEGNTSGDVMSDGEMTLMKQVMGFSGFKSTKNTKVPGNNVGSARKDKHIKARQYMNRVGGFNRPLSPSR